MKISLLVIRCLDIDESKRFYEQLGLSFVKEKHGSGPEHYSCEYDGVVFELYPNKGEAPSDNSRLGFSVENLIDIVAALDISSTYEFNGRSIYVVVDPDGRKVEIS